MPVRDRITNKKQLNKQKMAINVLGALNTEINTIWNKEILDVSAAFVPEIKHINNHFGIWRPRHKSQNFPSVQSLARMERELMQQDSQLHN